MARSTRAVSSHAPIAAAMTLTAAAAAVLAVVLRHVWLTARFGPICGTDGGGHCWACYAAPFAVLAAAWAWRRALEPAAAVISIKPSR